jgi:two-component system, chemotaxis family, sensor kinase CheA
MKLSDEQIKELRAIFKEEALSHIKIIGKIFMRLAEGGTGDVIEPLGQAYREAHGLKGSASTIGITRIAILGEKLEDVLKFITQNRLELEFEDIEMLLDSLDIIRLSLDDLSTNVEVLTENEIRYVDRLNAFLKRIGSLPPDAPDSADTLVSPPPNSAGAGAKASPEKADDVPKETSSPKRELDLPSDQMGYLMSVFRTEASEHIKALAEMLFTLEEGKGDVAGILVKSFREAHSLKGSSGTIGFERVATVTHALEDVFGALQASPNQLVPAVIDVLLDTIDVLRQSVKNGGIGDAELSQKESSTVETLKNLVTTIKTKASEAETSTPDRPSLVAAPAVEPRAPENARPAGKTAEAAPPPVPSGPADSRETFIRVSDESIGNLIAQVGELFEAHLYLMSATAGLRQLEGTTTEILNMVSRWRQQRVADIVDEMAVESIHEGVRGLKTRLADITKSFTRDERQFSKLIQNSQEALRKIRLAPISTIFVMIRRQIREISRLTNKQVELFLDGGEYAVDRKVLEAIEDPLIHLLRNAVDHGIEDRETRQRVGKPEKGRINVVARHIGDAVELVISDDGGGIDPEKVRASLKSKKMFRNRDVHSMSRDELFDCLFESGVTTQSDVSKVSGRGVGLDVVKYTMERLGGEVRLDSQVGKGTIFSLRLPLSMSTLRCLLFKVSERIMAIPASNIDKVLLVGEGEMRRIGGGDVITFNGQNIPLGSLSELLRLAASTGRTNQVSRIVVIISFGERRFAFYVDDIIEYAQVILRPLGDLLERVSYVSGISLLGTGELALVLNPSDLVRASGSTYVRRTRELTLENEDKATSARILVVDDSMATRTLEKSLLESAGYSVLTASDGFKALEVLNANKIDIVITDIQMPNMNGLELTRTLKTQYRFLQLPVILVSSLGSDEDKARGLEIGADAYIVKKELSQRELIATIEQLL